MILNILQFFAALFTVYFACKIYRECVRKGKKMNELKNQIRGLIVSITVMWIINILIGYVI